MTHTSLDELLKVLSSEWAMGVARLNEFERLFGKVEHVKLLNLVGGEFFADVQQIMWDDLLLRVTRLTDRPKTAGKDNLTIRRLPGLCERDKFPEVQEQVDQAVHAAEFARLHRNQRISHKNLDVSKLPATTLGQIEGALDAVRTVLSTVNMGHRCAHLSATVTVEPRVEAFLGRTERLVDAVLCVEELIGDASGQAPPWDDDVARDCIRRLGGVPSPENVRRIKNLRYTAGWLRPSG